MSSFFKKLFFRSIKDQLMLMVMTITIVITLLICISFLAIDVYRSHHLLVKEMIEVSDIVGKKVGSSLVSKDKFEAYKVLEVLEIKKKVQSACVYDNEGNLFSFYKLNFLSISCKDKVSLSEGNYVSRYFLSNKSYEISRLILSDDGSIMGKFVLSANLQGIYDNIVKYIVSIILVVIPIILFAYFLASYISYFLVSRIKILLEVAKAVKQGDYSARAKLERFDEIGDFAETFDIMIDEVENLTNNLENIVANKTDDLKKALDKANYMQEVAEKASSLKNEWICNIGHEIRTPVHAILSYSSFGVNEIGCESDKSQEMNQFKKYFSCIKKSSLRLSELIEDLLDFGKLEAGKLGFNFQENNLLDLVNDISLEFENELQDKNINLIICNSCNYPVYIFDRKSIGQVLSNLINNAIKFSPKNKKIEINIEEKLLVVDHKETKEVFVSIQDQGIGIPDEELKDIFDTFRQSSKTKTGAGGTGLGLSISRKIIEYHGGKIWVESLQEKGALFVFTIPVTV